MPAVMVGLEGKKIHCFIFNMFPKKLCIFLSVHVAYGEYLRMDCRTR